jgi:hypothetical protein
MISYDAKLPPPFRATRRDYEGQEYCWATSGRDITRSQGAAQDIYKPIALPELTTLYMSTVT